MSRRRPTVNLILDLLSGCAQEKLTHRSLFDADGPLLGQSVITLAGEDRVPVPLLAHVVVSDDPTDDLRQAFPMS